jgi:hypothetical protein
MAMPVGALIAGPLGAAIGTSAAQYAAAGAIIVASALALIPRDVRNLRSDGPVRSANAVPEETVPLATVWPGVPQAETLASELEAASS